MISVVEALRLVEKHTPILATERVDLDGAVGRVLAENIVADSDMPPFDRSQMDGYAVIAADTKKTLVDLTIVGESAAGRGWHKKIKSGQAVRIMTGAPVPAGADAIAKIEITRELNGKVQILESIKKSTSIVGKGAEIKKGKIVIKLGEIINENNISTIAAFGYAKVKVAKRPRVSILATGSEIVDLAKKPGRDQIRNSNSLMLKALAEKCGAEVTMLPSCGDDISDIKFQISNTVKKRADILIITGGVSVGKYDLTKAALDELGADVFFEKLKLKPGKPAVFARLGKTLVFGLPGNPVSAAVTFYLFARKAIMQMQGAIETDLKKAVATLATDAKAARDRDTYLPSVTSIDKHGRLIATSLRSQGSSDFVGFARADSLIFVRAGQTSKRGAQVEIKFL